MEEKKCIRCSRSDEDTADGLAICYACLVETFHPITAEEIDMLRLEFKELNLEGL